MAEPSSALRPGDGGDTLLADLLAINDEVDVSAQDMEGLARSLSLPDATVLSAARLRFSRALRRHLQLVAGPVQARLRTITDAARNPGIDAYRRLLHQYHEAAAHHVARWPSTAVAEDWNGYRRSTGDMLALLRQRVAAERRDIHPLLTEARSANPPLNANDRDRP